MSTTDLGILPFDCFKELDSFILVKKLLTIHDSKIDLLRKSSLNVDHRFRDFGIGCFKALDSFTLLKSLLTTTFDHSRFTIDD
jgi:hypothetical protein